MNWILGIATYFMLPALGPVYFDPGPFADLPYTEVSRLQDLLCPTGSASSPIRTTGRPGDRRVRLAPRRDELHGADGGLPAGLGRRWKQDLWGG